MQIYRPKFLLRMTCLSGFQWLCSIWSSRIQVYLTAEYSEDYSSVEKGKICKQDKEANSRVSVGSVIKLTISLGLEDVDNKENVIVPEITGLTLEEAKSKLESVNLYLDVESEKYNDKRQEPLFLSR